MENNPNDNNIDQASIYMDEAYRRDSYFSELVRDIIDNNKTNQKYKGIFFGIVCFVFLFTVIFGVIIILVVSTKKDITYADIGVALTGFGSVVSSVIVLPQIIAKHLFPEDSESVRFKFIKDNQQIDQSTVYEYKITDGDEHFDDD